MLYKQKSIVMIWIFNALSQNLTNFFGWWYYIFFYLRCCLLWEGKWNVCQRMVTHSEISKWKSSRNVVIRSNRRTESPFPVNWLKTLQVTVPNLGLLSTCIVLFIIRQKGDEKVLIFIRLATRLTDNGLQIYSLSYTNFLVVVVVVVVKCSIYILTCLSSGIAPKSPVLCLAQVSFVKGFENENKFTPFEIM